jgi:hypothetical protein
MVKFKIKNDVKYILTLPAKLKAGRPSKKSLQTFNNQLKEFAKTLSEFSKKLGSRKYSSRGWSYLLESVFHVIDKSQFDYAQKLINKCRAKGILPLDFCLKDESRRFYYLEDIKKEYINPLEYLVNQLDDVIYSPNFKNDITFWMSQKYYIQMLVEKIDVREMFRGLCRKYHIPLANAKGWSDINSRASMVKRMKVAEEFGLKNVLLYFGDHDPDGIKIAESLRDQIDNLKEATKWDSKSLIIDYFGLHFDFIEKHGLTWVDNLISGSGKPLDRKKQYVKNYIEKFGVRKCEANAVVIVEDETLELCEQTILKYLDLDNFNEYNEKVNLAKNELEDIIEELGLVERLRNIALDILQLRKKKEFKPSDEPKTKWDYLDLDIDLEE